MSAAAADTILSVVSVPCEKSMKKAVHIEFVSDVMCPWCAIAFASLNKALMAMDSQLSAYISCQPFELNPDMPAAGQNLREHLTEKYGSSKEDSIAARERITQMGKSLGFEFNFTDDQRMLNTFNAHQLLLWAEEQGWQPQLEAALFTAYFRDGRDVSNAEVLVAVAAEAGLDPQETAEILADQRYAMDVRVKEQQWQEMGIRSVPAVILQNKYLIAGAQPPESYIKALSELLFMQDEEQIQPAG